MMIGPAPIMRMVEISVRLGIGFLGSFARRAWAQENAPSRPNGPEGAQLSGNERGIGLPRSLAEIGVARKSPCYARPRMKALRNKKRTGARTNDQSPMPLRRRRARNHRRANRAILLP